MKKLCLLLTAFGFTTTFVKAQDINQIIAGSKADVSRYMNAYFKPFGEGQVHNLARGWFSTGKAHKKLGFDISVRVQTAIIPSGEENFTFRNSDYESFRLSGGATSGSLPTYMGGETNQQIQVTTTVQGPSGPVTGTASFQAPNGIGDDFKKFTGMRLSVPLPVVQVGVGLLKNTDVKVRYLPKTNIGDDASVDVMGVAVQHELSNYLPFFKKVPLLHLSLLAGYTKVNVKYQPAFNGNTVSSTNGTFGYDISALTVQAIASAKLAFLEVYAAVGYSKGESNLNIEGTYNVKYNTNFPPPNNQFTSNITNPASMTFTGSGMTTTAGVRLNVFFLKFFADYTMGTYNGLGAGLAVSIR